jgi:hypothetical protein
MASSAIWEKHARVRFSQTIKKSLKNSRMYVLPNSRETILLLINNIH